MGKDKAPEAAAILKKAIEKVSDEAVKKQAQNALKPLEGAN
jgi:hypothetical protein